MKRLPAAVPNDAYTYNAAHYTNAQRARILPNREETAECLNLLPFQPDWNKAREGGKNATVFVNGAYEYGVYKLQLCILCPDGGSLTIPIDPRTISGDVAPFCS